MKIIKIIHLFCLLVLIAFYAFLGLSVCVMIADIIKEMFYNGYFYPTKLFDLGIMIYALSVTLCLFYLSLKQFIKVKKSDSSDNNSEKDYFESDEFKEKNIVYKTPYWIYYSVFIGLVLLFWAAGFPVFKLASFFSNFFFSSFLTDI
jgi:hypothetical protein